MPKRFFGPFVLLALVVPFLALKKESGPTPYQFPDLKYFPKMPVSESNPVTVEGAELGRYLFYDRILSRDSTISCSGCHRQEAAFSDGPNRFSTGLEGDDTKRNTMPLFNLAWTERFFWDGRATTIEDQVFHPVRDPLEMDLSWVEVTKRINESERYPPMFHAAFGAGDIDSVLIAKAIGQFLRTLISNNSPYDRAIRGEAYLDSATYAGFVMINDQSMADCLHCHPTDANVLGTTGKFSNNGLDGYQFPIQYEDKGRGGISGKESEIGLFKIPSLRNVALTSPYMHDGRFQTLEEVLDFYSEGVHHGSFNIDPKMTRARQGGVHLTEAEKTCIIQFLKSLTDSTFITNKQFGDPFKD